MVRRWPPTRARSSSGIRDCGPCPDSRPSASTSPTRSSRCGTRSRSRPATRTRRCPTGRSRGPAASRSPTTSPRTPSSSAGRRVFDLGTGSGLVAIAAAQAGAGAVTGADIDPFAVAAARLNARSNGVRLDLIGRDVLDEESPDVDVVLAGDCWYEGGLGERATAWLRRAASAGRTVLLGDPGRRYLPVDLKRIAAYEVRTTTELEDLAQKTAGVYAFG